jgi:sensor histidine kinase regulating citrate/malate metabolism
MKKILSIWFLLVITISCVLGVLYVVVQQEMRQTANDPQIQIAQDTAKTLDSHRQITFSQESIDVSESLSPFIMTFNDRGILQGSEAVLDGVAPAIPFGVFTSAKQLGEDRVTWEPKNGVRIAAVVVPYTRGYVLVGRNMREVEKREDQLSKQIILGWMVTLLVSFLATILLIRKK